jgi:predicted ArsR family transcriptional regulator
MNRLDALGDSALRTTLLFVRAQGRPATADDVAIELAVPRTVARSRLERLASAGLVVTGYERRNGRSGPGAGRPAKTYAAAAETTALEFPPRRYESLIRLLIDTLPQRRRARQLADVGYAFGLELARAARLRREGALPRALERLCRGLGKLGFQASLESVAGDEAVIVSATCPLRPVVTAGAEARAVDEGMWRGLTASAPTSRHAFTARRTTASTRTCLAGSRYASSRIDRIR